MSAQNPERLRGGIEVAAVDEAVPVGATGAAEFVVVGTGFASVDAGARRGQEAVRSEVT